MKKGVKINRKTDFHDALVDRKYIQAIFLGIIATLDTCAKFLKFLFKYPILYVILPVFDALGVGKFISETVHAFTKPEETVKSLRHTPRVLSTNSVYFFRGLHENWKLKKEGRTKNLSHAQIKVLQKKKQEERAKLRKASSKPEKESKPVTFAYPWIVNVLTQIGIFINYITGGLARIIAKLFGHLCTILWTVFFLTFGIFYNVLKYVLAVLIELFRRIPIIGALVPIMYLHPTTMRKNAALGIYSNTSSFFAGKASQNTILARKLAYNRALTYKEGTGALFKAGFYLYFKVLIRATATSLGLILRLIYVLISYPLENFSTLKLFLTILGSTLFLTLFFSGNFLPPTDISLQPFNISNWSIKNGNEIFLMFVTVFSLLIAIFSIYRMITKKRVGTIKREYGALWINEAHAEYTSAIYNFSRFLLFLCALLALSLLGTMIINGPLNVAPSLFLNNSHYAVAIPSIFLCIAAGETIKDIRSSSVGITVLAEKQAKWIFILSLLTFSLFTQNQYLSLIPQLLAVSMCLFLAVESDAIDHPPQKKGKNQYFYYSIRILLIIIIFISVGIHFSDDIFRFFIYLQRILFSAIELLTGELKFLKHQQFV
ncbi:hypothetical protein NEFER03_0086 [Nematocida sp. LUAm3]|nr:hypothetical protein NEFER03_0086 [Nematocida sp. LUAm3]KAI5173539.1 hypothetical protein NEFER02_0055 [Nematocida sp. LUAm2]KAI5176760.1 hypothetical protein NEFER01_0085 [Nematocida sp. LUAm1]